MGPEAVKPGVLPGIKIFEIRLTKVRLPGRRSTSPLVPHSLDPVRTACVDRYCGRKASNEIWKCKLSLIFCSLRFVAYCRTSSNASKRSRGMEGGFPRTVGRTASASAFGFRFSAVCDVALSLTAAPAAVLPDVLDPRSEGQKTINHTFDMQVTREVQY